MTPTEAMGRQQIDVTWRQGLMWTVKNGNCIILTRGKVERESIGCMLLIWSEYNPHSVAGWIHGRWNHITAETATWYSLITHSSWFEYLKQKISCCSCPSLRSHTHEIILPFLTEPKLYSIVNRFSVISDIFIASGQLTDHNTTWLADRLSDDSLDSGYYDIVKAAHVF